MPKSQVRAKEGQGHLPHSCTFLFGQRRIPGVLEDPEAEVDTFENVGFSQLTEATFSTGGVGSERAGPLLPALASLSTRLRKSFLQVPLPFARFSFSKSASSNQIWRDFIG